MAHSIAVSPMTSFAACGSEGFVAGFTKKYNVKKLVWFEIHSGPVEAITREKRIKKWNWAWKVELINSFNPSWKDLFEDLV